MVKMRYYVVRFRFEGKLDCIAGSPDFLIDDDSTWHEVQECAEAKLMEFFSKIFPDEALPYLMKPVLVEAIPGALFFTEDKDANR